jgi:hypothetical protein
MEMTASITADASRAIERFLSPGARGLIRVAPFMILGESLMPGKLLARGMSLGGKSRLDSR